MLKENPINPDLGPGRELLTYWERYRSQYRWRIFGLFLAVFGGILMYGLWSVESKPAEIISATPVGPADDFIIATTTKSGTNLTIRVYKCQSSIPLHPEECFGAEALQNASPEVHGPITLYFPTALQLRYGVVIDGASGQRLYDIQVTLDPDPEDYSEADSHVREALFAGLIVPLEDIAASSQTVPTTASTTFGP